MTGKDPLLTAREIISERLQRDVPDDIRRFELASAITTHLDMAALIVGGVGALASALEADRPVIDPICDDPYLLPPIDDAIALNPDDQIVGVYSCKIRTLLHRTPDEGGVWSSAPDAGWRFTSGLWDSDRNIERNFRLYARAENPPSGRPR